MDRHKGPAARAFLAARSLKPPGRATWPSGSSDHSGPGRRDPKCRLLAQSRRREAQRRVGGSQNRPRLAMIFPFWLPFKASEPVLLWLHFHRMESVHFCLENLVGWLRGYEAGVRSAFFRVVSQRVWSQGHVGSYKYGSYHMKVRRLHPKMSLLDDAPYSANLRTCSKGLGRRVASWRAAKRTPEEKAHITIHVAFHWRQTVCELADFPPWLPLGFPSR